MTTVQPNAPIVLREAAEACDQDGWGFAAASASLHSLSVSAEAARDAVTMGATLLSALRLR